MSVRPGDRFAPLLGPNRGGGARAEQSDDAVARLADHLRGGFTFSVSEILLSLVADYHVIDLDGVAARHGVSRGVTPLGDGRWVASAYELGDAVAEHLDEAHRNGRPARSFINVAPAFAHEFAHVAQALGHPAPPMTLLADAGTG